MHRHLSGRDTDVVEKPQLEDLVFAQFRLELSIARKHHKAHPFAMRKGVNPNQVQGVGQGQNGLLQIDAHGSFSVQ